jgi:hypothetical protein
MVPTATLKCMIPRDISELTPLQTLLNQVISGYFNRAGHCEARWRH